MLDNLTQRLAKVVKTMRGEARLTETNTAEMLREVRLALLEADVALPAVREFIAPRQGKGAGRRSHRLRCRPGQALVGVVQRELAALMGADLGPEASQLSFAQQPPAIVLMAGLQGAGKTTTVAKLARFLIERQKNKKFLAVVTPTYIARPRSNNSKRWPRRWVRWVHCGEPRPTKRRSRSLHAALHAGAHGAFARCADRRHRRPARDRRRHDGRDPRPVHAALRPHRNTLRCRCDDGPGCRATSAKAFNDALPLTG